jgi:Domain of unknown function (DUF6249)
MGPDILRDNFHFLIPILSLMIPIVAIVAHYVSKSSRERERHETIRALAKAGQPIPPELIGEPDVDSDFHSERRRRNNPNRSLTPGVINVAVGLGLMGMFSVMKPGAWLWAIGLIPFCLGLGFLLLWSLERKQTPQ